MNRRARLFLLLVDVTGAALVCLSSIAMGYLAFRLFSLIANG